MFALTAPPLVGCVVWSHLRYLLGLTVPAITTTNSYPLLFLPNRSVRTARSTSYSSTLPESGTTRCVNIVPMSRRMRFQRSRPTRGGTVRRHTIACKSRSTIILTVCCSSQRVFFSASGQFAAAEQILISTTKPLRRRPDRTQLLLLLMAGDIHPNPGPTVKYPCPVCA